MTLDLYINEANDYARDIRVPVLHPLRQDRGVSQNEFEIGNFGKRIVIKKRGRAH